MFRRPIFLTIFAGLSLAEGLALKTSSQKLACYDKDDDNEKWLNATDYISDIQFESKINVCRISGIWILYDEDDYKGSTSFWMYGYNNPVEIPTEFQNKVSSLRFPGGT